MAEKLSVRSSLRLSNPLTAITIGTGAFVFPGSRTYAMISFPSNGIVTTSRGGSQKRACARKAPIAFSYERCLPGEAGMGQRPKEYKRHARMKSAFALLGSDCSNVLASLK